MSKLKVNNLDKPINNIDNMPELPFVFKWRYTDVGYLASKDNKNTNIITTNLNDGISYHYLQEDFLKDLNKGSIVVLNSEIYLSE